MATFVLVHGAWHGGWCWRDVRTILRANGHIVFTPTLTGLGERSHQLSLSVDLDTHIQDVVNVLEWEELRDVILVGHSYGGQVITGVADRAKRRLGHVVYLDAYLPDDGESLTSQRLKTMNPDVTPEEIEAAIAQRRADADDRGGTPPRNAIGFGVPADRLELCRWVDRLVTPHPVNSQIQPIRLENGGSVDLPRTYVVCTGSASVTPFMITAKKLSKNAGWRFRELAAGHDVMVTLPEETAALLMEAAAA